MADQLNDIVILVNNEQQAWEADSLSWKEGQGEYNQRNAVVGGGQTETIFSEDLKTKFGMVKFSLPTTAENVDAVRGWKVNKNNNVVELIDPKNSGFTRIFTQACITGDPESNAATEGTIEVEFQTAPAQ